MRLNIAMSLGALLTALTSGASASRVLEKDGVKVGWPRGTQLAFEILENYPDLLPSEGVRSEVSQAMQLWNAQVACDAPPLSVTGPAAAPPKSGDGKNTIAWVFSNWTAIPNASVDSPGVTDILIGDDSGGGYRILEADIYLNAEDFKWTTDVAAAGYVSSQQVQYVKEVVAHELGHALGLDHPCEFAPPANVPDCASGAFSSELMFPESLYVEPEPLADDVSGLCGIYQDTSCNDPASGCVTPSPNLTPVTTSPVLVAAGGQCIAHADCQPGLACISATCARGTGVPGDSCDVYAQCENGSCVNGACREFCSKDVPCSYDQVCDAATSSCGIELKSFGQTCGAALECASAQCLIDADFGSHCTKVCGSDAECPVGWQCSAMNDLYVCSEIQPSGDGCSISTRSHGSRGSSAAALLLAISILGLRLQRHQRLGEN